MDFAYRDEPVEPTARYRRLIATSRDREAGNCETVRALVLHGPASDVEWRAGLRMLCDEARAENVPADQLIDELTEALRLLCDACAVPDDEARATFSSRIVRLCLDEYFADRVG